MNIALRIEMASFLIGKDIMESLIRFRRRMPIERNKRNN